MNDATFDPLSVLRAGLSAPGARAGFAPQLRGETGMRVVAWLREEALPPDTALEAGRVLEAHLARFAAELPFEVVKRDMRSLFFERFEPFPRFLGLLQEALTVSEGLEDLASLQRYTAWLATVLTLQSGALNPEA